MFLYVSSLHVVPTPLPLPRGQYTRRGKGNQWLTFDAFTSNMASFPDLVKSAAASC